MHQPLGYRDPDQPNHVRLLKKSIYGHQQAPRAWYQRFADYVSSSNFCHSTFDHSLFIYHKGSETADLLTYVDDIILTGSPHALCKFSMKDLIPLSYFFGYCCYTICKRFVLIQKSMQLKLLNGLVCILVSPLLLLLTLNPS